MRCEPPFHASQDWQFFDRERLLQLQALEAERALTAEEKDEKQRLLQAGFAHWSRRDLSAFIRCETDRRTHDRLRACAA